MDRDTLPVIDPATLESDRSQLEATVHGVVLAAGTSERYGDRNKLLAERDGEGILRQAVQTLTGAALEGVTVVAGHEADRVRESLADLDVAIRVNERYRDGQGTSVATGTAAAREAGADAVLIALGDMPDVSTAAVEQLLETYRAGVGSALAAAFEGQRGNPVVFDRRYFDALTELSGDRGGRSVLLSADDAAAIETGDPGVLRDVDRPEDC